MGKYSKFISDKRRAVDTPHSLVENGKAHFGTFKTEFKNLNPLDCKKPTPFPNAMKKLRLTLWEAMEIDFPDGYLLLVICDMGLFGLPFAMYFDYKTNTLHEYGVQTKSNEIITGPNLIDGNKTYVKTDEIYGCFTNNLQDDKIHCECEFPSKNGEKPLKINVDLERVSKPSIVGIPFGKYEVLYSQKDLFKVTGSINVNGEEIKTVPETCGVIDDHRGYYPRNMFYDWLSFMGIRDGKRFGFNTTHNQSIDEENYNENIVWMEGKTSILPPVRCTHVNDCKTIEFESPEKTPMQWIMKDEHDMINLTFDILGVHKNLTKVLGGIIVDARYFAAFGLLNGYVRDEDGNKYEFHNDHAIGEDKRMKF